MRAMSVPFSPARPSRLKKRAGDLARGVHALLDIHRQREEVDVAEVARGRGGEHARVAGGDDDGAGGLLGQLARLEGDLGSADLDGRPECTSDICSFLAPLLGERALCVS